MRRIPQPFFSVTFLVLFFVSLSSPAYSATPTIEAYFSPNGGAHDAVVDSIDQAKKTIDIAMYSFSSGRILSALKKAIRERKVRVRLLFDDGNNNEPKVPGDTTKAQWSQRFENAGMDVRYVYARNEKGKLIRTMHNKFIIVDGFPEGLSEEVNAETDFENTILINASGNFSGSSDNRYNENWVKFRNAPWVTTEFQKEFHKLWNYSFDFPSGRPLSKRQRKEYRVEVELAPDSTVIPYFTSANFDENDEELKWPRKEESLTATRVLKEAIERAQESIYVATGHNRLMALANALIDRSDLDIRVVSDSQEYIFEEDNERQLKRYEACVRKWGEGSLKCEMVGGYHLARYLFENGIPIRLKYYAYIWHYPYEPQMHHKYVIIDGKEVFNGSFNWSMSAEYKTFETLVHFRGGEVSHVVDEYVEDFDQLWNLNRDRFGAHKRSLSRLDKFPIHFGGEEGIKAGQRPMTLSIDEIDEIWDVLREEAPAFVEKVENFKEADKIKEAKFWDKKNNRVEDH